MQNSIGLTIENEVKLDAQIAPILSVPEQEQLTFIKERALSSYSQQTTRLHELNDLDLLTDDKHNRDSRNSFIRPKKNDEEIRVNTGTVEKKMMSIVNEILSLNMTPEVNVYDEQDKPIQELGDAFTNILKKTEEQEDGDDLNFPMLWDLATRRLLFVEEYQDTREVVDKKKIKYDLENNDIQFENKKYIISRPKKRLRDLRSVLLGDYSIPNNRYNEQPYLIAYDRKHWRTAYSTYHNFKNWQYVKPGPALSDSLWHGGVFDFRLFPDLETEQVEILEYYSYPDDEYQIIVNGVPLLPPNTPLPWEHEGYRIQAFVSREMEQNLACGQLFTINARVLASISDEMLRLIIFKWRQSIKPPTALKGKKVLSSDIWNPGSQASGISKDDIQKLIDNPGVTQSEMATFEMLANKIEEEVGVSKTFQGLTDRKLTAAQHIDQMKQAIKSIGTLVMSWMKVKRVMAYLRIYNVIENNIDPIDIEYKDGELQSVYKNFTIDNTRLDNNTTGTMVIQFANKDLTPSEEKQLKDHEDQQQRQGNYIRFKQINVEKLREFRLKWFVTVIPQEKDSSVLQKLTFTDELNQTKGIMELTGRRPDSESIINEFERIYKKKNSFEKIPTPQPTMNPNPMSNVPGSAVPAGVAQAAGSAGASGTDINSVVSDSIKREGVNSALPAS